jgi:hypothetical protein
MDVRAEVMAALSEVTRVSEVMAAVPEVIQCPR